MKIFIWKNLLWVILISIFVLFGTKVEAQEEVKTLRVFLLQSYEQNHFCGAPQLFGVKEALSRLQKRGYKVILREFYMNTKTKNVSISSMREIAKIARDSILSFNPDYIVVFDDNAFKYVAIPYLLPLVSGEPKWKVIFTGLNKPFVEYKKEQVFDFSRAAGVEEIIDLRKMFDWFDSVGFIPDEYYLLRDSSPTSFLFTKNIQSELKQRGYKNISIVHVDSIEDLKGKIKDLNSKPKGVIFAIQTALVESSSGKVWTMFDILREIRKRNTTHIEIGINAFSTRSDIGFAVAMGPDFYEMGSTAGQILIDMVISDSFESVVEVQPNVLTVNTERMNQLNLTRLYKGALSRFDTIDTSIED